MEELIEGVNAKVCTCCKELKPFSGFCKAKRNKCGYAHKCKACRKIDREKDKDKASERYKRYYAATAQARREYQARYRKDHPEKVAACKARHYIENKEEVQKKHREYYYENKEYLREKAKEYAVANAEYIRQYRKIWWEKNKETSKKQRAEYKKRYKLANKEKIKLADRIYRSNNKEKNLISVRARQVAKMKRTPCWLTDQNLRDIEDFYYLARALSLASGEKYVVDHIIPLQGKLVSGFHHPDNLQLLTSFENTSKGNKFEIT